MPYDQRRDFPRSFRGRPTQNFGYHYEHPPPWDQGPIHFSPPHISPSHHSTRSRTRDYRNVVTFEKKVYSNPSPNYRHSYASRKSIIVTDSIQSNRRLHQEQPIRGKRKRPEDKIISPNESHKTDTKRARISTHESKNKETSPSSSVIFIGAESIDDTPASLHPVSPAFRRLTSEILEYDRDNSPSDQLTEIKLDYCEYLVHQVQRSIYNPRFIVFGSSLNGFSTRSSDLDITLIVQGDELYTNPLRKLYKCLRRHSSQIRNCQLITAKVPIVMFEDVKYGLEIDISLNNHSGIRNTFLLRTYSRMDPRVRPLVVVVKEWAKHNNVCNSKSGLLSSYALNLMVLFFLQHAVSPQVLPSLQRMYPDKYNAYHTIDQIKMVDIKEVCHSWKADNNMSVGELLVRFFEFYAKIDLRDKLISIRTGCLHERPSWEAGRGYKGYINIEEPYTLENAARSVYLLYRCKEIISEFKKKYRQLSSKNLPNTLDDVLSETV